MSANRVDEPVSLAGGDLGGALIGVGLLVMVLFPFAIPALVLTAALAAPLVLPVAVLAIAGALVVSPFLVIRRIVRRVASNPVQRSDRSGRGGAPIHLPGT